MPVIGVTGTNGKTTTAYLLAVDSRRGRPSAPACSAPSPTASAAKIAKRRARRPEAPDVQQLLSEMLQQGCRVGGDGSVVARPRAEARRRHALRRRRLHATSRATTSTSTRTWRRTSPAKRRLFEMLPADAPGVINIDDPRGAALRRDHASAPVTYGINAPADVTPGPIEHDAVGACASTSRTPKGTVRDHVEAGRPAERLQHPRRHRDRGGARPSARRDRSAASPACPACRAASKWCPRRGDEVTVVVDYAHTDDALRNLLETARPLAPKRLITVFGCGGDRDRSKRPLMGMVAARLSDVVVITSDNPRTEDPARIIDEIERGIPAGSQASSRAPHRRVGGRSRARPSSAPSRWPRRRSWCSIAGKGHEKYQQIGDRVLPFDDGEVARAALARRRAQRRRACMSGRTDGAGRGNDCRGHERPAGRR